MTCAIPAILAAIAVRNPFWPIGYEGVREVISPDPVVEVKGTSSEADDSATAAAQAAEAAAEENAEAEARGRSAQATPRQWQEARRSLKISGSSIVTDVMTGRRRHSVIINGGTYADGDLVSANHDGHRFTWRVTGITNGATLKLKRLRARPLEEDRTDDKTGGKK